MELREQIVQTTHARRRWGYRMKFLTVADDFTRECVDITADFGIG